MNHVTQLVGDCFELLPQLGEGSIDLVIADLPYGTTRNRWDSVLDLDLLWAELARVASPTAAFVFTAQMPFTATLLMSKPAWFRHHWIWEKTSATGHLNAKRAPMKAHEDILVFARRQPTYNPQMTHGHERKVSLARHERSQRPQTNWGDFKPADYDSTSRYPRTVQRFAHDRQKLALHPTQKPQALIEYLIRTYSNDGDTVLDPTSGSGTTGVAALAAGRNAILIESDAEMADRAVDRIHVQRSAA